MHHSVFRLSEASYVTAYLISVKTTLGCKRKLIMDRWLEEWMNEVMTAWSEDGTENRDTATEGGF